MGELLRQRVRVVADGEHVLLDGRRLGLEGHELVRDGRGVEGDLDDALLALPHQRQPLVELLQHLVQGFPVRLRQEGSRREERVAERTFFYSHFHLEQIIFSNNVHVNHLTKKDEYPVVLQGFAISMTAEQKMLVMHETNDSFKILPTATQLNQFKKEKQEAAVYQSYLTDAARAFKYTY